MTASRFNRRQWLAHTAALLLAQFGVLPPVGGVLPVAWGLLAAIAGAVLGSLASRPTDRATVDRVLGTP